MKSLFVYTKANYEGGLRAAARYHANEGVSVKYVRITALKIACHLHLRI